MCRLICFREQLKIGSKSGEMFQYGDINQHVSCHVEMVVLLSKGAKGPVDLCLAWTEAERRQATYEQIKAYVLKI